MKALALAATLTALMVSPLAAQTTPPSTTTPGASTTGSGSSGTTTGMKSRSECETMWKSADRNSDGRLDKAELDATKASLPSGLTNVSMATQTEYLNACTGQR